MATSPRPASPARTRDGSRRRGIALLSSGPAASSPAPGGAPAAAATSLHPSPPSPPSLPAPGGGGRQLRAGARRAPGRRRGRGEPGCPSPPPLGDHGMLHRALHPHFPLHFAAGKWRRSGSYEGDHGGERGVRLPGKGTGTKGPPPPPRASVPAAPGPVKAPVPPQLRLGGGRWRDEGCQAVLRGTLCCAGGFTGA